MPTCAGCNHRFDRWADLEKHVVENHCQLQQDGRSILQLVQDGDLNIVDCTASSLTPELRKDLRYHICLIVPTCSGFSACRQEGLVM